MAYVGTFHFWFISDGDGDEDEETPSRTPAQWSMLPIISRYRLCRTANTTKTRLVTFENTLWCPQQEHGNYQCSEPDCPNPTSDWRWKHVRGANTPIASRPPRTLDPEAEPVPGSELTIPCVVAHWTRLNAREILKRDKALIFDIGMPDREWALLEVRPANVWRDIALQWAENHLKTTDQLTEFLLGHLYVTKSPED